MNVILMLWHRGVNALRAIRHLRCRMSGIIMWYGWGFPGESVLVDECAHCGYLKVRP